MAAPQPVAENYSQPTLPNTNSGWKVNCVDMQVVTKSDGWNPDQAARLAQLRAIKNLGANYVSFGTPYNETTKFTNFVTDARTVGLKVFFRSHWDEWEGDNSVAVGMTCQEYLDDTYDFIIANESLFQDGDIFSMCVEPNNANDNDNYTFRTPETEEGVFQISKFTQFLKDQVTYTNAAFTAIGKSLLTCVSAPSLSLMDLAGQTLDSGSTGNSSGFDNADVVAYWGGILSIDHYLSSDYRFADAESYWSKYSSDLDKLHTAYPDCQIFVSEWGYHTSTDTGRGEQHGMYEKVVDVLRSKDYIMGVSFWNHMGQASSSIFDDSSGTIMVGSRNTRNAINRAFTTGNSAFGARARA